MRNFWNVAAFFTVTGALLCVPITNGSPLTAGTAATGAQTSGGGPERVLFDLANQERKANGVAPLVWDDSLASAARRHAMIMAEHGAISHQFADEPDLSARLSAAGARFGVVAENVAVGPSAGAIHAGWMKSPPHRANLLDPALTSLGIGVAERNGDLFAVEDFSRATASLSLAAQESRVGAELEKLGLRILEDNEDARRTCMLGPGHESGKGNLFLFQYSSSDLDKLPRTLEREIRTGRYRTAEVGACGPEHAAGFSNYQIAVVLNE